MMPLDKTVARVDISSGKVSQFDLPEQEIREYLGGRGIGSIHLLKEVNERIDPLDAKNKVMIFTGPLTGLPSPASSRFEISTISTLTSRIGSSNAGGFFGSTLRKAGFFGIIIEGKSKSPVYLNINEGNISIEDAEKLWGKDTYETEDLVKEQIGNDKARVLSIGPAGENLVSFASVMCDRGRASARSGAAAVIGSKNLKAIAVSGNKSLMNQVSDKEKFKELASKVTKIIKTNPIFKMFTLLGTPGFLMAQALFGDVPVKNWTDGWWDGFEKISGVKYNNQILVNNKTCHACAISCKRQVEIPSGPYKMAPDSGPEYETLASLGSLILINNLPALAKANDMANRMGIDTVSLGNVLAFASECIEQGKLSRDDLSGVDLKFGNEKALLPSINHLVERDNKWDLLAKGVKKAGDDLNAIKLAIHVKGLELAMHDPRSSHALALHYATYPSGGRHSSALSLIGLGIAGIKEESFMFGETAASLDKKIPNDKALPTIVNQNFHAVVDSSGSCTLFFQIPAIPPIVLSRFLSYVLGEKLTYKEDILKIGERIFTSMHLVNLRQGLKKEENDLPWRLKFQPHSHGGAKGIRINLPPMLQDYYTLRNWDPETLKPSREKLKELNLEKYI
ncbi:MAG: aldehyde ferredoxin oxidoreductase family protein [Candidatus Hodarchaeota archaeon]